MTATGQSSFWKFAESALFPRVGVAPENDAAGRLLS